MSAPITERLSARKEAKFGMDIPEAVIHALKQLALTDRITAARLVADLMQKFLEEKGLAELAAMLEDTGRKRRGRPPLQRDNG